MTTQEAWLQSGASEMSSDQPVVLMVDDEQSILSALGRALRHQGYELLTAPNSIAALETMTRCRVDVVLSDMRMPKMDGAELLSRIKANWPRVTRVLITGQADINQAIRAINRGGVHYYVSKPWDDDDLRSVMAGAVERARVYRENECLMALTRSQNLRLAELNAQLEAHANERTEKLQSAMAKLEARNKSLNASYQTSIRLLSNLIEMRPGIRQGFARDVADLAMRMARMGERSRVECMQVYFAGQLHELGKVGLPQEAMTETDDMSSADRELYRSYPMLGKFALEGTEFLRRTGEIIGAHREDWNGRGFPDRLSGHNIPQGARILRVARDYVATLASLRRIAPKHRSRHALMTLHPEIGSRYDFEVMHWLEKVLERQKRDDAVEDESQVVVRQLLPGMVLSREFQTRHGVVMLARDHELSERNIDHLADLQALEPNEISVWVYT